jgi:DNA polymerase I-like protein with 3'-5' exonuclease and polymerase domains
MKPRETLGPRPGCLWYLPDYSQIEVWLFAFLSENKVMMEALLTGKDFHGTVAETVWGKEKDYQKRHTYYRKCAKLIMFCTLYGGGIGKLAQLIMCSYEEAAAFRARHAEELPGLKEYLHRVSNRAQRAGYIVNAMGRHCAVPSDKPYRAVNYEIQGAAADIQKEALINIYDLIVEDWPGCNILMSMHDESLIEVPYEYHSKELMREIVECMQRAADPVGLPVKLPVGMKICTDRWYKTKEIPLEDAA